MSVLMHYGTPRHSGRYPWGSGKDPYQNAVGWRGHVKELRDSGMSENDIARAEGISIKEYRDRISLAKKEVDAANFAEMCKLVDKGYSNVAIGERMGVNESVIRSWRNQINKENFNKTNATIDMLRTEVNGKTYIDIGPGVEEHVGITRHRLNTAVRALKEEGYQVYTYNEPRAGDPSKFTTLKVLAAPDTEWKEFAKDRGQLNQITAISKDFGRSFDDPTSQPIQSIDSKRVQVVYGEEGRSKDGTIELRRGVDDLDLGNSNYAQVRVGVDNKYYLKGMAIYSDDMPPGIDIKYNSAKSDTGNKFDAMKKMKVDDDGNLDMSNPFGATIKVNGRRGALNVVNEEGDWMTWSKTLSSQFMSKQPAPLAKKQLDLAYSKKKQEFDEINSLTNPVLKKQMLLSFGDDCDSSAVNLKAAGLPRQASKVILPIPSLNPGDVYAPDFNDGERVVLIRHPHGGRFEIPELTVNNRSKEAASIVGKQAKDAIGIHPETAQRLSGADFDGDTVIVIPNNSGSIKTKASLRGLKNFDPQTYYPAFDGMKTIDGGTWSAKDRKIVYPMVKNKNGEMVQKKPTSHKQKEMGVVSNLITDMTIKGASDDELAKAVRHSMVVIDSEKHALNYKQSALDNEIAKLHERYQSSSRGGASTLISRAKSEEYVSKRKERSAADGGAIDPNTGKKLYTITPEVYTDKNGKVIERKTAISKMSLVEDARELSSGKQIEEVYAGYANDMKALGNRARKIALETAPIPYNPSAKKTYSDSVASLNAKLSIALKNKPLERQSQTIANSIVSRKKQANRNMDSEDIKKITNQALATARARTGSGKQLVKPTEKEWEAIQAGAISSTKLTQILQNADLDHIKKLATPHYQRSMSSGDMARARTMLNSGSTLAEVASLLGFSASTISKSL